MTEIRLAKTCTAPCNGTADACLFGDLIQRLDEYQSNLENSLSPVQVDLLRVNAAHCVQIADGLRTAIEFAD